jgi:hypothetical protein
MPVHRDGEKKEEEEEAQAEKADICTFAKPAALR